MNLIPKPYLLQNEEGLFCIAYQTRIVLDEQCGQDVWRHGRLLQDALEKALGYRLELTRGAAPGENAIRFQTVQEDASCPWTVEEGYRLAVRENGIMIQAAAPAGFFYGVQTLRQIVSGEGAVLPALTIEDFPAMPARGFYHDATRGRIPTLASMKELADKLSYYKMNQLQLYIEHSFLFSRFAEVWRDDTPITPEEILELDEYCKGLHIELVPSLSTFGHHYKLLGTKTWNYLCELEGWQGRKFSFRDRMHHHTFDVSNPQSMALVKEMIDEYMPLFTSKLFNICGDETFDLGKGKSKEAAEKHGIRGIYMNYIKELCEYVMQKGRRPMFWGDIICSFPDAVQELPEGTVCLNWGYSPEEKEDSSAKLHQAGAVQYSCPGVSGWNHFVNEMRDGYENIVRMVKYAYKYQSIGVLNTDWGDYGHINHPDCSIPGMIYGAAFSWRGEVLPFEEINRQISRTEYQDSTERFVSLASSIAPREVFRWFEAVEFMEAHERGDKPILPEDIRKKLEGGEAKRQNALLQETIRELYSVLSHMDSSQRIRVKPYIVGAEGVMLFNRIGAALAGYTEDGDNVVSDSVQPLSVQEYARLASELEGWLRHYKEVWRSVSREGELYRIQHVVIWYADYLREM